MNQYTKAVVGALVAGLGALQVSLLPDTAGVVAVTAYEWVGVAVSTLTALAAVWAVTNSNKPSA